jgi:hypothetical protein
MLEQQEKDSTPSDQQTTKHKQDSSSPTWREIERISLPFHGILPENPYDLDPESWFCY